jgi:hypothetical protein
MLNLLNGITLTQLTCTYQNEQDCRSTSIARCLLSADMDVCSVFEGVPLPVFILTTFCLTLRLTKYVQFKKVWKLRINVAGRR